MVPQDPPTPVSHSLGQPKGPAIEESPESFFARFRTYAVEAHLFPEPWGSPVLEAMVQGQILYAFDRGAPPAPTGVVPVLLHGVVRRAKPLEGAAFLEREGASYRLGGRTTPLGEGFYLLQAPVPVVVHAEVPLPEEAEVLLWPPLMLFRE
ncbi:hypothetical protein AN926_05095 [Thermus scotoductus]|jgi:hypothetical protein|uniref:Uncharacterized protein n=1 Tax=Thermus scotoductus TaxID=37636 RepID=A0A0N0IQY4_THESC|nr:hypothetical protein [Thermus sp. NMX2.A1]ETN89304.1 hypothetical protein TNMX_02345 [Thermus sp. NMX2.A1]KPD32147.1 hypothetical protein AN926_05095 [Thermus scotoductus]